MERKITQVAFAVPQTPKLTRVAAYARVSSGKDAMLHSLSAQVSYYNDLIQNHPGWLFCGVYADEALSGTKDNRENFLRLIQDCKAGKVDMVITKSISRFARNTVTLLETVRELKSHGVDVFFEEQNIHSISADGELMLTILASYAQEESLSASENQKWRIRHNFQNGMPWSGKMLGYRYDHGTLVIQPSEAEVVRDIFAWYLEGLGVETISKRLNEKGAVTRCGHAWSRSSVLSVLRNYAYTGNLLLQTTYRENHLTKRKLKNNGQLPQYHISDSHEPIIPLRQFNAVQEELQRRAAKHAHPGAKQETYPFTGKIVCARCGKHYRRKIAKGKAVWICSTYNTWGKDACPSKQIPEETLIKMAAEALRLEGFDADAFSDKITAVRAEKDNTLVFLFKDSSESVKRWKDRSRAESWTTEMKEAARQKELERRAAHG